MQSTQDISFGRSSKSDQEEEMEIGIRFFSSTYITPLTERIRLQEKNSYSFHSLKIHQRVVGYFSLFCFTPEFQDSLLCGTCIERDISLEHVLAFSQQKPFDVYVDVIVVDPELPAHLRNFYAGLLILYYTDLILHLSDNGYCIEHIYTVTTTPEGARLSQKLGMQPMLNKSHIPDRLPWVCNFKQNGYPIYRQLKERLVRNRNKYTAIKHDIS
ncbi:hypothetical protein [Dictyobacter arantiisoli]|uniref:N-acetyltransferase domain-containing protein n=1 Tax=Dictyobacter arantiisoli TaxID=2014874 RepID=A0A5A5T715_9CHLR|nr:hypothetical protein [Dictyobacter arantiisoli]GCF07271.1 hypothetical protein KDI_08350 [Dictyobacter arantiisoli]